MKVLLVQNHGVEDADMVGVCFARRGVPLTVVNAFESGPLPPIGSFDAAVVFGSPASCTELKKYPFLLPVRELVGECIAAEKPVLGICFGGQLLAQVLGAQVRVHDVPEVGCHDILLTDEGRRSPYFTGFPPAFPAAQWHNDTFDIPAGATRLAGSALCANQAFAVGPHVGLQFHIEASHRKLQEWMIRYRETLPKDSKSPDEMLADFAKTDAVRARLCDLFVGNFLDARGRQDGASGRRY
jgi:GMP synthase (glutamine-hydrolysing)